MKRTRYCAILLSLLGVLTGPSARGAVPVTPPSDLLNLDWRVYVAAKPVYCILVEKDRQRLRVLRHDGRIGVKAEYTAGTGENFGPKEEEGDAKTPEGVYLITKRYLDHKVSIFGTRAFHLNYPNAFDIRAGRTGNGIYIHGTDKALRLTSSNGCVTLDNGDLEGLSDFLALGTPVFIVPSLTKTSPDTPPYPNLTEHDFAGAKALLIPEGADQADFASLYLIRINGQTMVAGEYWPDRQSATPRSAVAYLERTQDDHWVVVDRGPATTGSEAGEATTIADLPPELACTQKGEGQAPAESWPWPTAPADLYAEWAKEVDRPTAPEVAAASHGVDAGTVYGLLGLATVISLGSALLLTRRQTAAIQATNDDVGRTDELREEVRQAMARLQTVQELIAEEGRRMESHEALQARVDRLEEAWQMKQAAIAELTNEQVRLREQGSVERSGQDEAIAALGRELHGLTTQLAEARQAVAGARQREATLTEQMTAMGQMMAEEREAVQNARNESQALMTTCHRLQEQAQAMTDSWQASETTARRHESEVAARASEMVEALRAYAVEMKVLHGEVLALRGGTESGIDTALEALRQESEQGRIEAAAEKRRLVAELAALRAELVETRTSNAELSGRLGRLSEMETMLATRDRDLATLRANLAAAETAKADLAGRLTRMAELETALATRDQELATLRQQGETLQTGLAVFERDHEAAMAVLRADLAAAETTNADLAEKLTRMTELETTLTAQGHELATLRQQGADLKREAEKAKGEQQAAVTALGEELTAAQTTNADLTTKLARMAELEAALAVRNQELNATRQDEEALRLEIEQTERDHEVVVSSLRQAVTAAETANAELSARLTEREASLAARDQELATLRQQEETLKSEGERSKHAHEAAVGTLEAALTTAQTANATLSNRLSELEAVLTAQGQERATLRHELAESRATTAAGVEEQRRLEAGISELVLARQVEITNLTTTLQEVKDRAESERQGLATRIETLGDSIRQATDRAEGAERLLEEREATITALRAELGTLKTSTAELEKRAAKGDGVVLLKGAHYLPGDVLRKWIGKEQ